MDENLEREEINFQAKNMNTMNEENLSVLNEENFNEEKDEDKTEGERVMIPWRIVDFWICMSMETR